MSTTRTRGRRRTTRKRKIYYCWGFFSEILLFMSQRLRPHKNEITTEKKPTSSHAIHKPYGRRGGWDGGPTTMKMIMTTTRRRDDEASTLADYNMDWHARDEGLSALLSTGCHRMGERIGPSALLSIDCHRIGSWRNRHHCHLPALIEWGSEEIVSTVIY